MRIKNNQLIRGSSSVEIMALIVFVIGVMIGLGVYLERGTSGHWKATGDAFGQGKQYDPRAFGQAGKTGGSQDCFFDPVTRLWIDEDCYSEKCDCTLIRADGLPLPDYAQLCTLCKIQQQPAGCICLNPPPE